MALFIHFSLSILFGLLGNIVSFLVYLAPMPAFYRILKKRSTEGFQSMPYLHSKKIKSIPYSVALFSAMLYLYYAFLVQNGFMLITINTFGIFIESHYLIIYMIFTTRDYKIFTAKLLILFNLGAFGLILLFTSQITTASKRLAIVGWICAVFSLSLSAAHPLAIMRLVIRTKILEFMPFSLSLCQTICAVMWFMYGLSIHDYYIAAPNILGMAFGLSQMILYLIYSKRRNGISPEVDIEDQPNKAPVNKDDQVDSREAIEINTIQLTM